MTQENKPANRKGAGKESTQFKPGQSGNPSGRKKMPEDVKRAFKELTPVAIEKLTEMINNPATKDADRLRAIDIVLDRGLGKPSQEINMDAKVDSAPVNVVFTGVLDEWSK